MARQTFAGCEFLLRGRLRFVVRANGFDVDVLVVGDGVLGRSIAYALA
ncbi:hypothetical protein AB0K14_08015 [Actinosynnema sp. NPDC050801]